MTKLTVDRTALALADLVFNDHPEINSFWIPEGGITRPGTHKRNTYAPDSVWVDGSVLLASVKQQGTMSATCYTQAASKMLLDRNVALVEEAFDQFSYPITLAIGTGDPEVWQCDPADVDWGTSDSGMVRGLVARAMITIPVYPIPGSL